MPDPSLVFVDGRIDVDRFVTDSFDSSREPHYTISEMGKFFFNRTTGWVRWRERRGGFILGAVEDPETRFWVPVAGSVVYGTSRTPEGARYYTLADVEGIAHALAEKSLISGTQLHLAVLAVHTEARIFGYI